MRPTTLCFLVILTLALSIDLASPRPSEAETKTIIAEGSYTMGDGETPTVAESRALHNAKRMAIEQAGTYLQSFTRTKNFQLTEDELQAISAALVEVEVLEKKRTVVGEGFNFYVKIKATVTTDRVKELAASVRKRVSEFGPNSVGEYRKLKGAYEQVVQEIELLKKQLKQATSAHDRDLVMQRIAGQEQISMAVEWELWGVITKDNQEKVQYFTKAIETIKKQKSSLVWEHSEIKFRALYAALLVLRGKTYIDLQQFEKAVSDLDEVIAADPGDDAAYTWRGATLIALNRNMEQAVADYSQAIRLKPGSFVNYYGRALAYNRLGQETQALDDLNEAIRLNPNNPAFYRDRGQLFRERKLYKSALEDFSKGIALKPDKDRLYELLKSRATTYHDLKEYRAALADVAEAIRLRPNDSEIYLIQAAAYTTLEQPHHTFIAMKKSCDLGSQGACQFLDQVRDAVRQNCASGNQKPCEFQRKIKKTCNSGDTNACVALGILK